MTEAEWLKCAEPYPTMLEFLRKNSSARKKRLLSACCLVRLGELLSNDSWVERLLAEAIRMGEQFVDGNPSQQECENAQGRFNFYSHQAGLHDWQRMISEAIAGLLSANPTEALYGVTFSLDALTELAEEIGLDSDAYRIMQNSAQAGIVRDIFGNPFRPVTMNPAWQNWNVVPIAEGIYEERAFERMPILADALEDAGCDDDEILQHCRSGGPHVRGCWVVDLILGKA